MAEKKGMSPWAWVAIGCGVLVVLVFVVLSAGVWFAGKKIKDVAERFEDNPAKAAAEMVVKVNPELELVESDDDSGTMTIRFKETGEVATFDYSDIQEGRISFESAEGKMSFDVTGAESGSLVTVETDEGEARFGVGDEAAEMPAWLPAYPGAASPESTYTASMEGMESGAFGFETADPPAAIFAYYRSQLEAAGFDIQEHTTSQGGTVMGGLLSATSESPERSVNVVIGREGDTSQVSLQYNYKP